MLKNYALIALRNLKKKPVFSFINIFGLAVGLATCIIIYFYTQYETSFDRFHSDYDRIYRVTNIYERPSSTSKWVRTPPALAPAIRDNFPGIGSVTRMRPAGDHVCSIEGKAFQVDRGMYADSTFFKIFDFQLKLGDGRTALEAPNSIVISEDLATRFFGTENPMGQTIRFDNLHELQVTGVLNELPPNSHLQFEYLISFSTYVVPDGYLADLNSWGWGGFYTYIMLDEGVQPESVQSNINDLFNRNYSVENTTVSAPLQPIKDVYLEYTDFTNLGVVTQVGDKTTIRTLSGIAILVLIVAGLNFMNLSTAMSLNRGKEIGMRKVMGALRGKIRRQFLVESLLQSLFSLVLALILVFLVTPTFKDLLNVELPTSIEAYMVSLPIFAFFTGFIGLMAGIYPALVLSGFNPIIAMKGQLKTSSSGTLLRKGLTVFQFVISVGLIAISLLIVRQTNFMRNQPLGFDKDYVFSVNLFAEDMDKSYEALKNAFLQNPRVTGMSRSSHAFDGSSSSGPVRHIGAPSEESVRMNYYQTGYDFLSLMDIELIEGRFFSKEFPMDTTEAVVLNETAVEALGLESPIGTRLRMQGREKKVIGVVKDFHISSLHTPITPMNIVMPFASLRTIMVKINSNDIGETLASLEEDWKGIVERAPFDVVFLDDGIQSMYEREERLSKLIGIFTVLAVILACLGLYGLVTFSVQARLKEVGIRKVLGGGMTNILSLLSREFLLLILMANLISWPLVYFFGNEWLNNFSYKVEMGAAIFLLPMILLLVIALVTLSHLVIKAALTNPVKVLRNE